MRVTNRFRVGQLERGSRNLIATRSFCTIYLKVSNFQVKASSWSAFVMSIMHGVMRDTPPLKQSKAVYSVGIEGRCTHCFFANSLLLQVF